MVSFKFYAFLRFPALCMHKYTKLPSVPFFWPPWSGRALCGWVPVVLGRSSSLFSRPFLRPPRPRCPTPHRPRLRRLVFIVILVSVILAVAIVALGSQLRPREPMQRERVDSQIEVRCLRNKVASSKSQLQRSCPPSPNVQC